MLPPSWEQPPIALCCDLNPRLDKSEISDSKLVHFVPMPAVEALTNKVDVSATRPFVEVKKGYTHFASGDVIFAKITPCMENGKVAVVPDLQHDLAYGSTEFHVIRPFADLPPLWFFYYLSSRAYRSEAEHNMTGAVGQRRVPIGFIAQTYIPLPPLNEQKRIVAKIEELFSELDAGEESLRRARRLLDVYRQSLLKQAFEGKLTAPWRKQNPHLLEAPDQLLARIQAERQVRYERQLKDWESAVEKWEASAVDTQKPKKPRAPKESTPIDSETPASLPTLTTAWKWTTLGEIAESTVGFAFKSKEFQQSGVRLLRGDNIEPRALRWTNAVHWPEEDLDTYQELLVHEGDIILAMDRPVISTGLKVAMARSHDVPCLLVQRVARIIGVPGIDNRFLLSLIDQQRFINHCLGNQTGTQLPHISEGQIRAYPVPLCSLPEQQEIVRLLDEQFTAIEQNEREIDASLKRSAALRQSILKKAFTGQLVPQDPADEPAAALLERIRMERDKAAGTGKTSNKVSGRTATKAEMVKNFTKK